MGLYDRDYSREDSWSPMTAWTRSSDGPPITFILIGINVAVFFANMILSSPQRPGDLYDSFLSQYFSASPETIIKPWAWYQFLTYGFLHSREFISHILFNMLGLFFFGTVVERMIGRLEFLRFYLCAIVFGGIVYSIRTAGLALLTGEPISAASSHVVGASGAVMAVTILFAFLEPHATIYVMMVVPVKAWIVAVLFVGMNIFGLIGSAGDVAYDVHLAGAAFAALYFKRGWRLDRFAPDRWGSAFGNLVRRRPRLKLHDPERKLAKEEAEADRLLVKIQESGLDSLTSAERKFLERHSRRKRESRGY
jgi:membrane associated rhomboid family serine protease